MNISREKFEQLALAEMDTLFRVARRLTRDAIAAQDLVQETYLRALGAAGSFNLEQFGIRPWLLRIMQNLYISRGEREKKQPHGVPDEKLNAVADPDLSMAELAGSELFDSMDEKMVAALENLPSEYQQAMLLWAVEDLSYKEIASVLEVPIGTVMSRLYRARERLSTELREYALKGRLIRE
jgi:RNA polymerase sigma-70 factor (ECF subfamily)